ncbi:MAG: SIS domain-containing protein [Bacteroidales bacterium]|nr:SIS domain-containing protein [Bacteroidales bacterium]
MEFQQIIRDSIEVKLQIMEKPELLQKLDEAARALVFSFNQGGRVFFCGNGGSAADAQHLAAELSGRFYYDREPLFAEALHVNTSYITAVANDYSFDDVYSRLLKAKGSMNDILIAISTSGNSENIIRAAQAARDRQMVVIGFTGEEGGRLQEYCNILLNVPSKDTPRIQESHIMIGHILCQYVEETLYPKKQDS